MRSALSFEEAFPHFEGFDFLRTTGGISEISGLEAPSGPIGLESPLRISLF